jgi:hypothetical protein
VRALTLLYFINAIGRHLLGLLVLIAGSCWSVFILVVVVVVVVVLLQLCLNKSFSKDLRGLQHCEYIYIEENINNTSQVMTMI